MNIVNDIIDGIAKAIYDEFGDGYTIYKEQIPQNADTPCFFILNTFSTLGRYLGERFKSKNHYVIQYIPPDDSDVRSECYDAAQRLALCLEFIDDGDGGYIRGCNFQYTVTEDLMEFIADFNIYALKSEKKDNMETITLSEELKG